MAVANIQVITEDRAPGGQVIDGSLRFDSSKSQYLYRTPGSAGNQKTWTFSVWLKRSNLQQVGIFCPVTGGDGSNESQLRIKTDNAFQVYDSGGAVGYLNRTSTRLFRDSSAWYHLVVAVDTTQATDTNRCKIYVNGSQITDESGVLPTQNQDLGWNGTSRHDIGRYATGAEDYFDGYMSQMHQIDGTQLDPSYFGFTDPLTNTWRPKKVEGVTYGTNGFYLPMDGNSPIGEDKSGNGNNFTPSGFNGTNSIEKATGALPILNTVNGGTIATVGVRTDSNFSGLGLALPLVGTVNDVSNQINSGSSTKTITKGNNVDVDTQRYNFYGGSHRFNGSTDYLDVAASSDFAFGTGDFTVECWIYSGVNSLDSLYRRIYMTDGPTGNATGNFQIAITPTSGVINLWETSGQLDVSGTTNVTDQKWNHIAAVRSGTTLKLYVNGVEEASTTYSTSVTANSGSPRPRIGNYDGSSGGGDFDGYMQDLRVYKGVAKYTSDFIPASTDPDILPDTPSGTAYSSALTKITDGSVSFDNSGDSLTTPDHADFDLGTNSFTIEAFIYLQTIGQFNNIFAIGTDASNGYRVDVTTGNDLRFISHIGGTWTDQGLLTDDPLVANRWYHVAVTRNGNDFDLWVNGQRGCSTVTSSSSITNPDTQLEIGRLTTNSLDRNYHGFISNLRFVNGSAVYTSPFTPPTAPLTNVTNTKLLCCQSNADRTAAAVSPGTITGNGNAQANTFNPFTTDINAVRGQESPYATLNPLSFRGNGSISDGNLTMASNSSGDCCAAVTLPIPTGNKIYLEAQHNVTAGAGNRAQIGVVNVNVDTGAMARPGDAAGGWAYDFSTSSGNSGAYDEGTRTAGPNVDNGDICMWCIDLSAGLMWAGKNGQWFSTGNPSTGSGAVITGIPDTATGLKVSVDGGASNRSELIYNFGQKPFKYNPPDGFEPLCTANLPRPTSPAAVRPDKYVGIVTYTGNATDREINLNFAPDIVWIKKRNGSESHALGNRMIGADAFLSSNLTDDENVASNCITGYTDNGFTIGVQGIVNDNTDRFVAWCWKAGGPQVTNNDGTITSYVSASSESGVGIVTYTGNGTDGATVGHGLDAHADLIIVKNRSRDSTNWPVALFNTSSEGGSWSHIILLNDAGIETDSPANGKIRSNTTNTTTFECVDGSSNANDVNTSGDNYVAYCFSEVPGFSRYTGFTGNGSADGPFIWCGFRPALVVLKNLSTNGQEWVVYDNERQKFNAAIADNHWLYWNSAIAEDHGRGVSDANRAPVDFLSNGVKIRAASNPSNGSGSTYIFMAWAEAPTNNLYGGQANAR